jgi:DNA-directed RNA polymerase II subunit RPB2
MQNTIATPSNMLTTPPPIVEAREYLDEVEGYVPGRIQVDEHGRLYKKYLRYEGFLDFLKRGFDNWIINILPLQLQSKIIPLGESVIYFDNPLLEKPMLSTSGQTAQPLWPEVARRRGMDYSGALYADLIQVQGEEELDRVEKVFLGMIPIPIGSSFDNISDLADDVERLAKGECPNDPGAYFIVKGTEKVILFDDKVAAMRFLLYNGKNPGEIVCSMTNETINGSSVTSVIKYKNNTLHLRFSALGNNNSINLFAIFKLFGMDDPTEIMRYIVSFTRDKWGDKILGKLNTTYLESRITGDPVKYIGGIRAMPEAQPYDEKKEELLGIFRRSLFPQLGSDPEDDRRRLAMVAQMAVRVLEYMAGFRNLDDRDDWSNKRLDPAAESLRKLFQSLFTMVMDDLAEEVTQKKYTQLSTIAQKVKASLITKHLSTSLSSNNFGIKGLYTKNIVDELKNANLLDVYSHLTRVRVTGQDKSHSKGPRMVQPTAVGLICPAETPEREGCGLIKNIAITSVLSVHNPSVDVTVTEFIVNYLSDEKTQYYDSKCWYNGMFLGWCPGLLLKEDLISKRRQGALDAFMSVVLDNDNILHVTTTSSRPSRPLLIVNTATRQLVVDEKQLWGADFKTLLSEGAAEYVDAFEENINAYIAQSIEQMETMEKMISQAFTVLGRAYARLAAARGSRELPEEAVSVFTQEEFETYLAEITEEGSVEVAEKEVESATRALSALVEKASFTHCELDPQAMWGFAASTIPLSNHNMGPRNTYQCQMGKQSLGIYHSQQQYRFPTTIKRLAFPMESVFETQMSEEMGFHDMPTGTNAIVAIISDEWGQEDAFLINRASLERGLFRYVKEFSKSATEKKEGELETIITRPPIRKSEPESRYINLDENGIVRIGSIINPRDALIGMVQRNVTTGQEKNVTIFAGEHEHGIVEEVLVTKSREEKKIVYVKIRDTRIPQKGDKFALRPSQKGTVGLIVDPMDLPRTASGLIPDIVMNSLAFPSRMTVGTLIEILMSKQAVLTSSRINATAFRPLNLKTAMDTLAALGYNRMGDEEMYSGTRGHPLQSLVFVGVAYVQKLKHDAEDKIQARAEGNVMPNTRQPVRGRAQGGGQRFGEMEGDAMMSHGAASILKEKLSTVSDATNVVFCTTCGNIAISNHVDDKYECRLCGDKASFARGTIPYVKKLMNQLLWGMNMGMKYRFRQTD